MPRKKVEKSQTLRIILSRSPELQDVARRLASLALADVNQGGQLSVRQREQLRRALTAAGVGLGWNTTTVNSEDPVADVSKDLLSMTKTGAKALARELVDDLARKKTEMTQISEVAASAREQSEDLNTTYPTEVTYHYTARDVTQGLATKVDTITVNDAREMMSAADSIERSAQSRGKLAELMIIDFGKRQDQIEVMKRTLPDFVKSLRKLLHDVLANLH